MVRLRTLNQVYDCVKETDPDSALTANALRRMVIGAHIPYVKVGKKYLIDLDVLFEYLKGTRPEDVLPGYVDRLKRNTGTRF